MGFVMIVMNVGQFLVSYPLGILSDRFNRKIFLGIGGVGYAGIEGFKLNDYINNLELENNEEFNLFGKNAIERIFKALEGVASLFVGIEDFILHKDYVYYYLYQKGDLALGTVSRSQFDYLFTQYISYKTLLGGKKIKINYFNDNLGVKLEGEVIVNTQNQITLLSNFYYFINPRVDGKLSYFLKIKGLIYLLLLNSPQLTCSDNTMTIPNEVILRYGCEDKFTQKLELVNGVNLTELLDSVLSFYLHGLSYPSLVDKDLIDIYSKKAKKEEFDNIITSAISNKINQDKVFKNNFEDFLGNPDLKTNSILFIVNILDNIKLN
jgi:hypothetical protein